MLMFWVGEDGALRTKDAPRGAAGDLDCELSGRQAPARVRVMPAVRHASPEFHEGIGVGGVMPRAEEPRRRRRPRQPVAPPPTFGEVMAAAPVLLPQRPWSPFRQRRA